MDLVVLRVLAAGAGDEFVEGAHLVGDVFHLFIDYADGFFVDGFGGGLEGRVVLVGGLSEVS